MPKPFRWGICAVLALFHDLVIVIAVFSILGWATGMEVDALFVTGVLGVAGVSVNNIVVVFDRIRENSKRGVSGDFEVVANVGIMESVGRSLNTGLATLFVIVALYLFGGVTIQNLILALLVGITTVDLFFFMYRWAAAGGLGKGGLECAAALDQEDCLVGNIRPIEAEVDNTTVNPAVVDVPVTVPVNTLVTVHCWTR